MLRTARLTRVCLRPCDSLLNSLCLTADPANQEVARHQLLGWATVVRRGPDRFVSSSSHVHASSSLFCPSSWPAATLQRRGAKSSSAGRTVPIPLAQTGEGIKECELISWFVQEGQQIEDFAPVCEVQSDKASVEITSRFAGTVKRLQHAVGDIVQVGETLLEMEVTGADENTTQDSSKASESNATSCSPAGTEAPAAFDDEMAPLRQGPLHPSHHDGELSAPAAAETQQSPATSSDPAAAAAVQEDGPQPVLAAPAVRKLAKDRGVELAAVTGTGPSGRIVKEDVLAFRQQDKSRPEQHESPSEAQAPSAKPEVVPLRGYRRAMVAAMTRAAAIPHCHFFDDVAVDRLLHMHAVLQGSAQLQGHKLTLMPFLLKALSVALQEHPEMNSSLAGDGASLLLHKQHNLGIAMATPQGLVVPNIKNVQSLAIADLASEMSRLQSLAQANRLSSTDLAGGTLTVSNIGSIGGSHATPLINSQEVAIVAFGRIRHVPHSSEGGSMVSKQMLPVSWGADHRVLDGAALARFQLSWQALLENPDMLLMHLR